MSEEIIKVLDDLSKRFGVAIDWSKENILPYVKELSGRIIKYNIAKNSIAVGIAFVFFVCAVLMIVKLIKELNDAEKFTKLSKEEYSNAWFSFYYYKTGEIGLTEIGCKSGIFIFFAVLFIAASTGLFLRDIPTLCKWIFIPELQIAEMLKDLIGS